MANNNNPQEIKVFLSSKKPIITHSQCIESFEKTLSNQKALFYSNANNK